MWLTSFGKPLDEALQTHLDAAAREEVLSVKDEDHPALDGNGRLGELQTAQIPRSGARGDRLVLVGDLRSGEDASGHFNRRRLEGQAPLIEAAKGGGQLGVVEKGIDNSRRPGVGRTNLLDSLAE